MATVEQMEKKRSRQVVEILAAIQTVLIEVAELKAEVAGLKEQMTPAMKAPTTRSKK